MGASASHLSTMLGILGSASFDVDHREAGVIAMKNTVEVEEQMAAVPHY